MKITPDAYQAAHEMKISIFVSNVIYELHDHFKNFASKHLQHEFSPAILTVLPEHIFSHVNPLILGVRIEGNLSLGSPLVIPSRKWLELGDVTAIRTFQNSTPVTSIVNAEAIVKIEERNKVSNRTIIYNREFDFTNKLYVKIPSTLPPSLRISTDPFIKSYLQVFGFRK